MFTLLHKEPNGSETIMQASYVRYEAGGVKQVCREDQNGNTGEKSFVTYNPVFSYHPTWQPNNTGEPHEMITIERGVIYVMNENGKTVGKYELPYKVNN